MWVNEASIAAELGQNHMQGWEYQLVQAILIIQKECLTKTIKNGNLITIPNQSDSHVSGTLSPTRSWGLYSKSTHQLKEAKCTEILKSTRVCLESCVCVCVYS